MSSLSHTISALAYGRQHNRILRLSFPNDDGPQALLLANRLEADEGLSRDFEYTVEVLAEDAGIALKDVQGKLVTISLVRGDGGLRHFNGYVFEFRLVKTDGGIATYTMVLRPWLAYLRLRRDNYLFHGKTLRQQTEEVFGDYGTHPDWNFQVQGTDDAMTMACQFDETDYNYLHRRWEAAGWHYWYEHGERGHTLVLSDDSSQCAPVDGGGTVRFQRHGGAAEEDAIGDWSPVRSVAASKVALSSFDFKRPVPAHVDLPTLNRQGDVLPVESYEYAGAYGASDRRHAEALALLRMEEIESRGKHVDAAGNCRYLAPGRWFRLDGHFYEDLQGAGGDKLEFLVLSVHHSASNNYLQREDGLPEYSNRLACIRKNVRWRPGRGYNSVPARIYGPQTAIVVGPAGQEIHTDEHGRVRVQFHWDRVGLNDEQSSAWVRVASNWAGGNFGAISLPRIGQEVIVQWLDSNPDRPIVTGRVYNGDHYAPWELPAQQALSGIRSRELKGGGNAGGRGNHLLMDDTAGQIQAVLSSDHQRSQLNLGYLTRVTDTTGRKDHRGEGFELRTDGWGAVRGAKGVLVTAWGQPVQDQGTAQQDNTEGADTLRAVLDSAEMRSQAASMATERRGELKNAHRGLKNQRALNDYGWSLSRPVVFMAAPDGIAASTPKSIVHAAGQDLGCFAAGNVDVTSGEAMSFSSAKGIQQHVERGGMVTAISHGDHLLHVQDGKSEVVSQKGLVFEAKSGDIVLKTKGGSIVLTESGDLLIKGANETHDIGGTIRLGAPKVVNSGSVGAAPSTDFWGKMNVGKFSQQLVLAGAVAGAAYKILARDGSVLQSGKLDDEGKTARVFTEDMEELYVEIDRNGGKWQFLEDVKHDPEMPADDDGDGGLDGLLQPAVGPAALPAALPAGIGILADKAQLPLEKVKRLFMPDGEIDVSAEVLLLLGRKVGLPAAVVVDMLRRGAGFSGKELLHGIAVHKVNEACAKLVAMVTGGWRGSDPLPNDVVAIFEQAAAQAVAGAATSLATEVATAAATRAVDAVASVATRAVTAGAEAGAGGIAAIGAVIGIGDDDDAGLLSATGEDPFEFDGMPADLRGGAGRLG